MNTKKLEVLDNKIIYTIDGVKYLTANDFARLLDRTRQSVDGLIRTGNRIRKLKSLNDNNKIFVPLSEVTEFPFTKQGQNPRVYHYSLSGKMILTEETVADYVKPA